MSERVGLEFSWTGNAGVSTYIPINKSCISLNLVIFARYVMSFIGVMPFNCVPLCLLSAFHFTYLGR